MKRLSYSFILPLLPPNGGHPHSTQHYSALVAFTTDSLLKEFSLFLKHVCVFVTSVKLLQ